MFNSDSRNAATKIYKKLKLDWVFNTSTFTGNFIIALAISYFFSSLGFGNDVNYVFFITILAIGLWITEAIPPFAVGIFIIAMLVFGFGSDYIISESSPIDKYVSTWTSNVIWLLLGGFFLAKGMSIVELDRALFKFTINRFGNKPEKLLLGLMFTTAFASMVMSNTATTAMMISSIVPLVRILGKESPYSKALLIGIPAAASVGGIGTIIGSTPNAIAVGALQEIGFQITFIEWMAFGFPTAIVMVYLFWLFLKKRFDFSEVELDTSSLTKQDSKINKPKRVAVIFTLIVTILLWLTEPIHEVPIAATSAVPIVLLTLTQVVNAEQVRSLPWDTLMLVAGGLAMGIAIVDVGLADIIMNFVLEKSLPILVIAIIFSLVGVLTSNVMSNTAASSILIPLSIALPGSFGIATPVIVAICCSSALLLPVSTPSNAISYATGLIEQKDFYPGGLFFIVIAPILSISVVLLWSLFYI